MQIKKNQTEFNTKKALQLFIDSIQNSRQNNSPTSTEIKNIKYAFQQANKTEKDKYIKKINKSIIDFFLLIEKQQKLDKKLSEIFPRINKNNIYFTKSIATINTQNK